MKSGLIEALAFASLSVTSPVAVTLLVVLPLLLLGCATSPQARSARAQRHAQQAVTLLANRSDADSLAAAGLLSLPNERERSLPLLALATQAAPERPELVWLQIEVCQKLSSCDPEPMERQLRALDPSNGAGWMGALARADESKDLVAVDAALAAIGHTERFDIYWTTLIAHLTRAAAQTRRMTLSEAETTVIGYLAAEGVPAYLAATSACKGERLQRSDVVEMCRGAARSFQHGDAYITEMIGVAIAKRVWPEDSPEWKAAVEARRVYEYRSGLGEKLEPKLWPGQREAERYLALCERNHREQDVLGAQLVEAGENPNPPPE